MTGAASGYTVAPGGTPSSILLRNVLAKIFRMLPLILADLDMRAKEMFINVLFTPEEKTFQYRVTSITTGGFKAKPALTKHGLEEVMASKVDLVRELAERRCLDLAVERMREMHAPDALGALWKV
jgi:hypothetical protein